MRQIYDKGAIVTKDLRQRLTRELIREQQQRQVKIANSDSRQDIFDTSFGGTVSLKKPRAHHHVQTESSTPSTASFGVPKNTDQTFWNPIVQQDKDDGKRHSTLSRKDQLFDRPNFETAKFNEIRKADIKAMNNVLNIKNRISDRTRNYILNHTFPQIIHGYFTSISNLISFANSTYNFMMMPEEIYSDRHG